MQAPNLSDIFSLIAIGASVATLILTYRRYSLEERERERRRVIELYQRVLYWWAQSLARWEELLDRKTFKIGYLPRERRCEDISGYLLKIPRSFPLKELEEEVLKMRLRDIDSEIISEVEAFNNIISGIYVELCDVAKKLDDEYLRRYIEKLASIWNSENPTQQLDVESLLETVICFLVDGFIEEYHSHARFIKRFDKELMSLRKQLLDEHLEEELKKKIDKECDEAREICRRISKRIERLTLKFDKKYKLTLGELRPEIYRTKSLFNRA